MKRVGATCGAAIFLFLSHAPSRAAELAAKPPEILLPAVDAPVSAAANPLLEPVPALPPALPAPVLQPEAAQIPLAQASEPRSPAPSAAAQAGKLAAARPDATGALFDGTTPPEAPPIEESPASAEGRGPSLPPPAGPRGADGPGLTRSQRWLHSKARLKLLAQRTLTLPAHFWPFTWLAKKISHGEALSGLSPESAVRSAEEIRVQHGVGTVVGQLAWELHDVWSVRGAVNSYEGLFAALAKAKAANPALDVSVALDVESLGAHLAGFSSDKRTRIVNENVLYLARKARDASIPLEFDMGASEMMPLVLRVTRHVVNELRMPVRLALSARYLASEKALQDWAALARQSGLKLGVRLVKGSFIESDRRGTINLRQALLRQYKKLITVALSQTDAIHVAVATHNEEIWKHARSEAYRLGASFELHAIRGVNAPLQARMRAEGRLARVYVSYGIDTPVMGLLETWTNWRQKRALIKRFRAEID